MIIQFLTGLASASSLFLVASGLSIIFGVTRIVNFAHGAFYMLGAYLAYTMTETLTGAFGFWGGILIAALGVALFGTLLEMSLLRRIYHAPELFQLLATFGVTLMVEDLVVIIWGPDDLSGPRAPGFRGAVDILGHKLPSYDLFLIVLGPLVLLALWLLFRRTRWGILVRAATQDRDMVAALGVNQKWLFTSVFALGAFLAGLGGALQIPRDSANHVMDLPIVVEVFVVVVIGGLGSVFGAFVAAVMVSELNAFGILIFPKISLILVFAVMAVVLVWRPWGLFGKPEPVRRHGFALAVRPWQPFNARERNGALFGIAFAALLPLLIGLVAKPDYFQTVGTEICIFVLFAASLQFLMSVAGLASFGHACYFGLGAYGAAFATKYFGLPMEAALLAGPLFGLCGATLYGWFNVRLSGVYFAMLTLAFAQITWSVAFQWVEVTGGDNGILGVWPSAWASNSRIFYWFTLAITVLGVIALRRITFSPFGYGLRAIRDSDLRAEAIGMARPKMQWIAFVIAGTTAGLAGALFAFFKGNVFPNTLEIPVSVDGLVMVLLGGIETVSGAIAGAVLYKILAIWLMNLTDHAKVVLGAIIVLLVVAFPKGLVGTLQEAIARRLARAKVDAA
ncbi:ABC transporter permease [Methylovirgula sp. 4M-Z18]|nr:ABC transporter permease [Methylovirgula sp. 4M-Z18]